MTNMAETREYRFDQSARIRAWVMADSKEEAQEIFRDHIVKAVGIKIDVESYEPEVG